jgi:DNA-binding beta-propeller fold protein YncE
MFKKPSVLHVLIAIIALFLGLQVYLYDRQPEHVYFLFHHFSLAHGQYSLFGVLGNYLPSFVHVYAFILLTVVVAGFSKARLIGTCVAWLVVASLFEVAQHPAVAPIIAAAVPAWFTHVPILDNTAAYFLNGTFDPLDLLSIVLGTIAAYVTIVLTRNSVNTPSSNKLPHSVFHYLYLSGIVLFGMLTIIGSGGGTAGTGTTVPGAGSQLYVSGNGSSTLMIYNDANTVSGPTAANRIVAGGMTTVSVPRGIAIDMPRNQLYVANTGANSILVFNNARTATGGDAPNRTISNTTPPITPMALFIDPINDRLYVANTGGNSVLIYDNASTLNGSAVTPSRALVGVLTTLISPMGIYVDTTRNLLYVANGTNQILVFNNADAVNGNIAPIRSIPILSASAGIFVDVMADRLYVSNTSANSIFVFDGASTSNSSSTPNRTLSGASMLNQPRDVFVDTGTDRLYVTNAGDNSIRVFNNASTVNNPASPDRTLNLSASTSPWGIYVDVTPVVIGSTRDLDGYARSDSFASASGSPATGDKESDLSFLSVGWRQLYSFDIASIPTSSAITSATLRLYQCDVQGSPYGLTNLGNVIVDHVNFGGTIDPSGSAYDGGLALNIGTLSTTASLGYRSLNVITSVQNDLTTLRVRSQYRLRFSVLDTNSNGNDDFAQFTDAEDSLCVGATTDQPPQLTVTLIP